MNYCFETNQWDERYIPELSRFGAEGYREADYYERSLAFDPTATNQLSIIVGSDSGALYRYLRTKDIPYGSHIVLLEPGDIFEIISTEFSNDSFGSYDPTSSSRVSLLAAESWQSLVLDDVEGSDMGWFLAGKVEIVQADCAVSDFPNCYYPIIRGVKEAVSHRRHALVNRYRHKIYIEEQMSNSVDSRRALYRDMTFGKGHVALVMGGGSSLDEHMDWILENRPKLFIIAVSRICGKLDELGLKPDLVMSMDPQRITYDFAKAGITWSDVPLIHSYHVANELLKQWTGPRYYVGSRFPWESTLEDRSNIITNAGPTVGHGAIVVAAELGFSQILLSGIDLCMGSSGHSHTRGTPESELLALPGNYDTQVMTYAGTKAGTSVDFYRSIDALEQIGRAINQHQTRVFNLNPHAVAIDSIPQIDFNAVELPPGRPEFKTDAHRLHDSSEIEQLRKEFRACKKDLKAIRGLCKKAHHCIDLIYGSKNQQPNPAYHRRLDTLEARLERSSPGLLRAVRYFMSIEFAAIRKPSGFSAMDESDMQAWARKYYQITDKGAAWYIKHISKAEAILAERTNELDQNSSIEELLQSWQCHQTPGRILLFHDTLLARADSGQQKLLQQARDAYLESLTDVTYQNETVQAGKGSIRRIVQCLRYLRDKGCQDDLIDYRQKLQGREWPYNTIATFIDAYVADMQDHSEAAIGCFQQTIDECSTYLNTGEETIDSMGGIVEETLNNLTRLYLQHNRGEEAATTLSVLSEISPQYIPSYANILELLGNRDAAIELLTLYLQNFPNNWRAIRQLAETQSRAGNRQTGEQLEKQADEVRRQAFDRQQAA